MTIKDYRLQTSVYNLLNLFFTASNMSGLPPFNVRRPHILANLLHRQGIGPSSRPRPLLPILAQSRHAHQHNVFRTN